MTHVCLFNGTSEYLCANGTVGCGSINACYDPTLYICVNGNIAERPAPFTCGNNTCNSIQDCCNGVCYDPLTDVCLVENGAAGIVCPITLKGKSSRLCNLATGAVCYDVDALSCVTDSTGIIKLCNKTDAICIGTGVVVSEQPVGQSESIASVPQSSNFNSMATSLASSQAISDSAALSSQAGSAISQSAAISESAAISRSAAISEEGSSSLIATNLVTAQESAACGLVVSALVFAFTLLITM